MDAKSLPDSIGDVLKSQTIESSVRNILSKAASCVQGHALVHPVQPSTTLKSARLAASNGSNAIRDAECATLSGGVTSCRPRAQCVLRIRVNSARVLLATARYSVILELKTS